MAGKLWEEAYGVISGRARNDIERLGSEWILGELLGAMPDDCERLNGCLAEQCEMLAKAWIEAIREATREPKETK